MPELPDLTAYPDALRSTHVGQRLVRVLVQESRV
jgi:hypothetical protein